MDVYTNGPAAPRPKAIPSHLINGHSPLHPAHSADRDREDRESAYNAIKASMGPHREPIDLEHLHLNDDEQPPRNHAQQLRSPKQQYEEVEDQDIEDVELKVAARDDRDEAPLTPPATSRSISPFTQNPTVDFDGLSWPSVGTLDRLREREHPEDAEVRLAKLSGAVRTILECIGEDPDREGLHGTPERYAKAMMFFTKGYEENLRNIVNGAVFHEDHDELVIVKDIDVYSLCEHHLVPFTGKVSPPFIFYHVASLQANEYCLDAHRLYPLAPRDRSLQARSHRRDVQPSPPSPRTTDETGRSCALRSSEAARCRSGYGEQPPMHGDARRAESWRNDDDKLYARRNEEASEDP